MIQHFCRMFYAIEVGILLDSVPSDLIEAFAIHQDTIDVLPNL